MWLEQGGEGEPGGRLAQNSGAGGHVLFLFVANQCVENMLMVKSLAQNAGAGLRLSDMVENMMMVKRLAQNTGAGGLVL